MTSMDSQYIEDRLKYIFENPPFLGGFIYGSRGKDGGQPKTDSDWDLWVFTDIDGDEARVHFDSFGPFIIYEVHRGGKVLIDGSWHGGDVISFLTKDGIDASIVLANASWLSTAGRIQQAPHWVAGVFSAGVRVFADPSGAVARWVGGVTCQSQTNDISEDTIRRLVSGVYWDLWKSQRILLRPHNSPLLAAWYFDRLHGTLGDLLVRASAQRHRANGTLSAETERLLLQSELERAVHEDGYALYAKTFAPLERRALHDALVAGIACAQWCLAELQMATIDASYASLLADLSDKVRLNVPS
jgi:hypothetical protein